MTKKQKRDLFSLPEGDFYTKLLVFYKWMIPVVLCFLSAVFFYVDAFLPGAIIFLLALFFLPINKIRKNIPTLIQVLFFVAAIFLALYSSSIYI